MSGRFYSHRPADRGAAALTLLMGAVLLLLALHSSSAICLADTIHLKNGRKIVGQIHHDDGEKVVYEREGNEFTIPRSIVERVERTDWADEAQPVAARAQASQLRDVVLLPAPDLQPGVAADSPVVADQTVNEAYLRGLEEEYLQNPSAENRRKLKQGFQEAAAFLTTKGDLAGAGEKYRQALKRIPYDLTLTLSFGYLLITQRQAREALRVLLPAERRHAQSADLHLLLGSAYYILEDLNRALLEWKQALAIRDNPQLRETVSRVEREQNIVGAYLEARSLHFLLRYEGIENREFSEKILATLEAIFAGLQLTLDYTPPETIVVLLYPNEAFRDVTRSPSWVGAINDGKIRLPVSGLSEVTTELARMLKHELVHSFVRQMTAGRCPTWFNEGLAQLEEGMTTAASGTQLVRAMAAGQAPPLAALEGSFVELPRDRVAPAYAKSLAALEYLQQTFGPGQVRRLLKLMPTRPSFETLLQEELRLDYASFEHEILRFLETRYGS